MLKMCLGSGSLAIPYAADEGGLIFHIIGSGFITFWNIYAVNRMVESLNLIHEQENCVDASQIEEKNHSSTIPISGPEHTSTLGRVVWHAFGPSGLLIIDILMFLLMVGVIISYEGAILGFVAETTFSTGSRFLDTVSLSIILTPIMLFPAYNSLSKLSGLGMSLILLTFVAITIYGVTLNGLFGFHELITSKASQYSFKMWPDSLSSFSSWFGVAIFGVGIVPFTYEFLDSMDQPKQLMPATSKSLWILFSIYSSIGFIIPIIFVHNITQDIISELPVGIFPTIVRISMSIVLITSMPLIIIPAGDLILGKLQISRIHENSRMYNTFITRSILTTSCAFISYVLPNFVYIVSFLGCIGASSLSLVLPPLLYIKCYHNSYRHGNHEVSTHILITDITLLLFGILATGLTSVLSFETMVKQIMAPSIT